LDRIKTQKLGGQPTKPDDRPSEAQRRFDVDIETDWTLEPAQEIRIFMSNLYERLQRWTIPGS